MLLEKASFKDMKIEISISVVITAYNEEGSIRRCLELMQSFLEDHVAEFEIILVNDGSLDNTALEAEKFKSTQFKLIHLAQNKGTGAGIKEALKIARYDWYCWFPSDLEILPSELLLPLSSTRDTDIVITYLENGEETRTKFRHYLSKVFVLLLNLSFSRNLRYYNGISLIQRELMKVDHVKSNGFFFHAELLIKTLARSKKYAEVPIKLTPRTSDASKAIQLKVLKDVIRSYFRILWEVRVKNESPNN